MSLTCLLVLFACAPDDSAGDSGGGGDDSGSPATVTPSVEIGGGETEWEELLEGSEHTMVHGPQGGWHMLGSVKAIGFDDVLEVHYSITANEHGDAIISDNSYRVLSIRDETDDTVATYPGMYGYLDVTALAEGELDTPPELLAWQEVVLHMEVVDASGHSASDDRMVIAAPDPADMKKVPE